MKVLSSSTGFRSHYVTRDGENVARAKALGTGVTAMGGVMGTAATAAGAAAAHASVWSAFTGLPVLGSLAAGKATAAGIAAGVAAAGSAAVLVPAALIGGGIAYAVYRSRQAKTLHKGSPVEELANAFAHVAWLPMLALAVSACRATPSARDDIREFVQREMGGWGYSEAYIHARFDEALKSSPDELRGRYDWAIGQLKAGSTHGIGATPAELPALVVQDYAEQFRMDLNQCLG